MRSSSGLNFGLSKNNSLLIRNATGCDEKPEILVKLKAFLHFVQKNDFYIYIKDWVYRIGKSFTEY